MTDQQSKLIEADIPEWMTKGKTTLIEKETFKSATTNNNKSITYVPMWKILTSQIREEIYDSLTSRGLFSEEQKGCGKESRGTGEQLYIDQHILNVSKIKRKNLAMAWIDYKRAYATKWTRSQTKSKSLWRKSWKPGEWNWQPEGKAVYIPGRCAITTTICNSNYTTQLHA